RFASTRHVGFAYSRAIVSARLAAVTLLPSPAPGLVIMITFTVLFASACTMRVQRLRYCRAVFASGECAATSVRSMRRAVDVRDGPCTGWIAGAGSDAMVTASATATPDRSTGSWSASGRIRSTAPSRSALSRMFCMRLISCLLCRQMADAAENRQLELVAELAFVVDRAVDVLAQQGQAGAEDDAAEDRAEPHAQRNGLDRRAGEARGLEDVEPLAAAVALDVGVHRRRALLGRELAVLLFLEVVVALDRGQLLFDHRRGFDARLVARDRALRVGAVAFEIADAVAGDVALGDELQVRRIPLEPREAVGRRTLLGGGRFLLRRRQFLLEPLNLGMLVGVHRPRGGEIALERRDPHLGREAAVGPAGDRLVDAVPVDRLDRAFDDRQPVALAADVVRVGRELLAEAADRREVRAGLLRQLAHVGFLRLAQPRLELVDALLAGRDLHRDERGRVFGVLGPQLRVLVDEHVREA